MEMERGAPVAVCCYSASLACFVQEHMTQVLWQRPAQKLVCQYLSCLPTVYACPEGMEDLKATSSATAVVHDNAYLRAHLTESLIAMHTSLCVLRACGNGACGNGACGDGALRLMMRCECSADALLLHSAPTCL
eukprot:1146063-Pelagomonas_calceolata.AAC.15